MTTVKTTALIGFFCLSVNIQAQTEFAQIPDYSGTTTSNLIASNQAFLYQNLGSNPNAIGSNALANALGFNTNGELAIVDNVYNPRCVAYVQYNQGSNASQSLIANNINLNCR